MVRNQKRVFRKFSYRECDRFAAFLRGQSLKGWHFKEWKMGFVFERGEKKDVVYDVQVFPKGREYDYKPEAEAKEYADYCEVAGWEFVDGQGRFCVFRKCGKDALPIVTEEEKFQNVRMAEWRQWLREILCYALLAGLFVCQYVLWPVSAMSFYNNMIMFIVCIAMIRLLWRTLDGIWLLFWGIRQKKRLSAGQVITYDKVGLQKDVYVCLREVFCLGLLFWLAFQSGYDWMLFMLLPLLAVVVGVSVLFAYLRPDRENIWMMQVATAAITMVMAVVVVAVILGEGILLPQNRNDASEPPLLMEDYKGVSGEKNVVENFRQTGVFGEMYGVWIEYAPENGLRYEIYRSPYPWMVERTWDVEVRNRELEECTAQWEAVYAGFWDSYCYYVKYEDAVWVLRTGEKLSDEQVQIVREKLEKID